jgi:hypothetical protein
VRAQAPIISASRRTDIPHFFGAWFERRRRAGFVKARSVFGVTSSISLHPDNVGAFLFWTKNAEPFLKNLGSLADERIPFAFQYTINGYPEVIEPRTPELSQCIATFLKVRRLLPSSAAIQWRYDPVLISRLTPPEWHLRQFHTIAAQLAGHTQVVNCSVVQAYRSNIKRLQPLEVSFRPSSIDHQQTPLSAAGDETRQLLAELASIARAHGLQLRACADPGWGLPPAQCCSAELYSAHPELLQKLARLKSKPTRSGCRCIPSADIGMDNTCIGGCAYCYAVRNPSRALEQFEKHSPEAPALNCSSHRDETR